MTRVGVRVVGQHDRAEQGHEFTGNDVSSVGRSHPCPIEALDCQIAHTELHLCGASGAVGDGAVEVARPTIGPNAFAVVDRPGRIGRDRSGQRTYRREVRRGSVDVVERRQRLIGPADLAQRQRQGGSRLGGVGTHRQ